MEILILLKLKIFLERKLLRLLDGKMIFLKFQHREELLAELKWEQEILFRSLMQEFLLQEGYIKEQIAVERNGEIVPKAQFEQVMLSDGDVLEIVHFVGGGC